MTPMKIYVAADAATPNREEVVQSLVSLGHHVYDPTRPLSVEDLDVGVTPSDASWERFTWSDVTADEAALSSREIRDSLSEPSLVRTFQGDLAALRWADVVLLLLPTKDGCLLQAGMAAGLGKRVYAYMPDGEADVWLALFDRVIVSESELAGLIPGLASEQASAGQLKDRLMADDDYE